MFPRRALLSIVFATLLCGLILAVWIWSVYREVSIWYSAGHTVVWISIDYGACATGWETDIVSFRPQVQAGFHFGMLRQRAFGNWSYAVGRLLRFEAYNRRFPPAGVTIAFQQRVLVFPVWVFVFPSAAFVWFDVRMRKRRRWAFRAGVTALNPRLRNRILRFAIFSVIGMAMGGIIAWADIQTGFSEDQSEWLMALLPLVGIAGAMAVLTRRRIPWHRAVVWMGLDLAGCIVLLEATVSFTWRYERIYHVRDVESLEFILAMGIIAFILAATVLLFLQVKPEPVKPGPYCPECGYCLIGATGDICTECGRPFTLEELGVADLNVRPDMQTPFA
jgi:hypothetical protein